MQLHLLVAALTLSLRVTAFAPSSGSTFRHAFHVPTTLSRNAPFFVSEETDASISDGLDDIDELQKIVQEASSLSMQADTRVEELKERVNFLETQISETEEDMKVGADVWSLEKTTLVAKVAELTNMLNLNGDSAEKEKNLEQQLKIMRKNLEETQQALEESKQIAEELRTRVYDGEDRLEYEQMRFVKEKKELDDRIEAEKSKLDGVTKEFDDEKQKFADERDELISKIDDALNKLLEAESKMATQKKKYDQETVQQEAQVSSLKNDLMKAQEQLTKDTKRFSSERGELKVQISDQRDQIDETIKAMKKSEEEFQDAKNDLEAKIMFEKTRVKKLTANLEKETDRFVKEKRDLNDQLVVEREKLTEVQSELQDETQRFETEKSALLTDISEGARIRKLKARQMNDRFTEIRRELTERLEATKRESRRNEQRLTKKYDKRLADVNENVERLQLELSGAKSGAQEISAQLGQMEASRDKVVREMKDKELMYKQTVSARNLEITGLKQDVASLSGLVDEKDAQIERYESSIRQLMGQSLKLTGKRVIRAPSRLVGLVRRKKDDLSDS